MIELIDDGRCFVCGHENPEGLRLSFSLEGDIVRALFIPQKNHQGYKDIVHGGIISTVLDEAMVKAAIYKGLSPISAELSVRFKSPLKVGESVVVTAKVEKIASKFIEASATLKRVSDSKIIAVSRAKLLNPSMP